MYQPRHTPRDRTIALALVTAIHMMLALALINLSGPVRQALPAEVVEMFDVTESPPPEPPVIEELKPKLDRKEGEASPPNIESKATPISDPKPRIELPVPVPMPVSPTPNQGSQTTQGAAPVPGPGTGAGGVGTGTGGGGSGAGSGGGGGVANPSRILRKLGRRDFPPGVIESTPRGGRIFTRLRIEANGRVSQCDVMRSFGDATADQWTCALIRQRATFQPATDRSGQPVASWFGYVQEF